MSSDWEDDEPKEQKVGDYRFSEFECPGCNAHNPVEPPFGNRSEVLCNYCGIEWEVKVSDEGKLAFRET